jgi:putative membrane protein
MQNDNDFYTYIRGIVLMGFMLLFIGLLATGRLHYYVAPKMFYFVYAAIIVFGILGIMQFLNRGKSENHCQCGGNHIPSGGKFKNFFIFSLFIIPLLTGFMLPEKGMESAIAKKRGVQYGSMYVKSTDKKKTDTPEKNNRTKSSSQNTKKTSDNKTSDDSTYPVVDVSAYYKKFGKQLSKKDNLIVSPDHYLDVMTVLNMSLDSFVGKQIEITGFIFRQEGLKENQAAIARFAMTCCSADATVYGIIIEGDQVETLRSDQWYMVTGKLDKTVFQNENLPIIHVQSLKKIKAPKDPYVYPSPESLGE